jgi:hypothetical protein
MIFRNLIGACDLKQVSAAIAAGTGDVQQFSEVNLSGRFDSVLFLVLLGAVTSTAVGTLRARGSTTSGGEGSTNTVNCFVDPLTGSVASALCSTGDSNTIMALDVYRPGVQYIKAELQRQTANIAVLGVAAVLYNSNAGPFVPTGCASNGTSPGYYVVANPTLSAT